jgi:hypothetical protein
LPIAIPQYNRLRPYDWCQMMVQSSNPQYNTLGGCFFHPSTLSWAALSLAQSSTSPGLSLSFPSTSRCVGLAQAVYCRLRWLDEPLSGSQKRPGSEETTLVHPRDGPTLFEQLRLVELVFIRALVLHSVLFTSGANSVLV